MKFTVIFVSILSITTPWNVLAKKVDEQKDKREAPVAYTSSGHTSPNYQSSQSYQSAQSYQPTQSYQLAQIYQPAQNYQPAQSYQPSESYQPSSATHGDASAISVGAGYSIGGLKPSYSYGGQGSALQLSSEGLPSSGHATIQLPPITLQPNHGGLVGSDISQIMGRLTQSINSGALSLQPSNSVAEFHTGGESGHASQENSLAQFTYPKLQQYSLPGSLASVPSYATGAKGLSTYGSTGPVLFNPSDAHSNAPLLAYASSGYSGDGAAPISIGSSGHALAGLSAGSSSSQTYGGSLKNLGGNYLVQGKSSFTPSAFLGASVQSDAGHGVPAVSGLYGNQDFGSYSGGHGGLSLSSGGPIPSYGGSFGGFSGESSKFIAPSFASFKGDSFGSPLEAVASFSSSGHLASPPGTTYGFPAASYPAGASHSASVSRPYYVSTPKHLSSSGGSSSFRAPSSSHSSLSSHSSGPKYSFGGHSSSRYSPKDTHGSHSETSYNTIKYSEELKPRIN